MSTFTNSIMDCWEFELAGSKAVPSVCVATTFSHPNPITVIANGSRYVYLLDAQLRKHIGVVAFSSGVVFVSLLYSSKEVEVSTVVCCLGNGLVKLLNLANVVQRYRKEEPDDHHTVLQSMSTEDVFEALLGDFRMPITKGKNEKKAATSIIPEKDVTNRIACSSVNWSLLATSVVNDNLVLCKKSHKTGVVSISLLRSTRSISISTGSEEITAPSFVGAQQQELVSLDTVVNASRETPLPIGSTLMPTKPVFSLVQSAHHSWRSCTAIAPDLFLSLFGSEYSTCAALVLLIGTQNGNIYFTNFQRKECDILVPLYSLGQPVVGIHYYYFPSSNSSADAKDPMAEMAEPDQNMRDGVPNTVIFMGQRGKIVILHTSADSSREASRFPSLVEFQVPAPLTSSVLVPMSCLLFTTSQGVYRICLRADCEECTRESIPNLQHPKHGIRIPHLSFQFPEKILATSSSSMWYLLKTSYSDNYCCTPEDSIQMTLTSLDGKVCTLQFKIHNDGRDSVSTASTEIVGQRMEQCLRSIETTGRKLDQSKSVINSLGSVLADFRVVLDLLCAVQGACCGECVTGQPHSDPFSCSFDSVLEDVGVGIKKLSMSVKLTYVTETTTSQTQLGPGWSFFVAARPPHSSSRGTFKSVSLSGMSPGNSVSLSVELECKRDLEVESIDGCIECYVHYTPRDLLGSISQETMPKFKGVSLFLCGKTFTILDFLEPAKLLPPGAVMETLSSIQKKAIKHVASSKIQESSSLQLRPQSSLLYSIQFPIETELAIFIISAAGLTERLSIDLDPVTLGTLLVHTLIPKSGRNVPSLEKSPRIRTAVNKMTFTAFHGSSVSVQVSTPDGEREGESKQLQLLLQSSSRQCLVQVMSAVQKVIASKYKLKDEMKQGEGSLVPPSSCHDQDWLRDKLQKTRELHNEVMSLLEESSDVLQAAKTSCMAADVYTKKMQELKSRLFYLFRKLREMS